MPLVPAETWLRNLHVGETFKIAPARTLRITNACLRLDIDADGSDQTCLILDGVTNFLTGDQESCTLLYLARGRRECTSMDIVLTPGQEYGLKLIGKDGMDVIGYYMDYEETPEDDSLPTLDFARDKLGFSNGQVEIVEDIDSDRDDAKGVRVYNLHDVEQ